MILTIIFDSSFELKQNTKHNDMKYLIWYNQVI